MTASDTDAETTGGTDRDTDRFAVDPLLVDAATNLFASTCDFDTVQAAEGAGWARSVWDAVAGAGFDRIGLPEAAGGSGGTLQDAAEVLRIAGAHAAPIPWAETGLVGGWALVEAGLALPDGPITVVSGAPGDALAGRGEDDGSIVLSGHAGRVAWADRADVIVAVLAVDGETVVAAIDPATVRLEPMTNLAGEPRPTVHLDGVTVPATAVGRPADPATMAERFRLRGTRGRVMLMAGALGAMSELTVRYTDDRQQFGRPVGRFQAVQQHLVWGAQDAAIATVTARVAAAQASGHLLGARFEIAAARSVADECATTATRWAHQAHGAMGMTQEYALHHLSRRLWAWRHEWSGPGEWPGVVGAMADAAGPDGLYPLITS
ncbi:MAG: acyl-CoA dehydrogenase family protein [Actinomycetota bacterium]